jgi:hypothetical protein
VVYSVSEVVVGVGVTEVVSSVLGVVVGVREVVVSVTGHTVVDTAMVSVTVLVVAECAGQETTPGEQEVIVRTVVL